MGFNLLRSSDDFKQSDSPEKLLKKALTSDKAKQNMRSGYFNSLSAETLQKLETAVHDSLNKETGMMSGLANEIRSGGSTSIKDEVARDVKTEILSFVQQALDAKRKEGTQS